MFGEIHDNNFLRGPEKKGKEIEYCRKFITYMAKLLS